MKYQIFLLFLCISSLQIHSQSQISQEDGFIYFMKTNGHKKGDNIQNGSRGFGNFKWFDVYVRSFMKNQYQEAKNNEFKMQEFINNANQRIDDKLKNVSFTKEFVLTTKGSLGKYNFNTNSFPIYFDVSQTKDITRGAEGLFVGIGSIINFKDLNLSVSMSPNKAEQLMGSLQQSGRTNRKLSLAITYNITKIKPNDKGSNGYRNTDLTIYVSSVKVTTDTGSRSQIANIVPSEWEDRVNGIKSNNGITRYDYKGYYTEIELKNGEILSPSKQYYNDGKLYAEIHYEYFNNVKDYKVKDFSTATWFFRNEKVMVSAMYKNNFFYGDRVEYYESGNIKDITSYKEGKKNGCSRQFTEDGQCKFPSIIYQQDKYFPFFKMGTSVYRDRQCGCDKPNANNYIKPSLELKSKKRISTNTRKAGSENSRPLAWMYTDTPPLHSSCKSIISKTERDICTKTFLRKAIENRLDYDKLKQNNIQPGTRISLMMEIDENGKFINIRSNRYPIIIQEVKRVLSNLEGFSGAVKDGTPVKVNFSFPLVTR